MFADKFSLNGGIWDFVSNLDLNIVGYFIVGLFVVTWLLAVADLALRAHRGPLVGSARTGHRERRRAAARAVIPVR